MEIKTFALLLIKLVGDHSFATAASGSLYRPTHYGPRGAPQPRAGQTKRG